MVKLKLGGILLSGFGAYLLARGALNTIERVSDNIASASKWKHYYKCYHKTENSIYEPPLPPGYSRHTQSKSSEGEEDNTNIEPNKPIAGVPTANSKDVEKLINEALEAFKTKLTESLTRRSDEPTGASEGRTEASESDIWPETENNEIEDPLYVESLENGVEIADSDTEGDKKDETLD